jgi:transposase
MALRQRHARQGQTDEGLVRLTRRHFAGIVAWTQTGQTNGFIEAIIGLFQAARRKARGYSRFETMRTLFHRR